MNADEPETTPGNVSVEQGQVLLDGPDGVAVAMSPGAAAETGRRLIAAAERALAGDGSDEGTPA